MANKIEFELSGEDGQKLVCHYHEIDQKVESLEIGVRLVVTGRRLGDSGEGFLQALAVEGGGEESGSSLGRLENFGVRGIRLVLAQRDAERVG